MLISQFAPTSLNISEHSDQYCGCYPISPIVSFGDNAPIAAMIKDNPIDDLYNGRYRTKSDGSEIVCDIGAPHKTYACQIVWQNMSYFVSYGKKWVCQTLYICLFRSVTLCHTVYISGVCHRIEHQVCNIQVLNTCTSIIWLWLKISTYAISIHVDFHQTHSGACVQ